MKLNLPKRLSILYVMWILLASCLCVTNTYGQQASFGNIYIPQNGEVVVYGNHDFQNSTNAPLPGIIGTERDTIGVFSFFSTSTYQSQQNSRYIDGYAKIYGPIPSNGFMLPLGDNGALGMAGIISLPYGSSISCAYFKADPNIAITSNLVSGNLKALPVGAPFITTLKDAILTTVSNTEYWDFNGSSATQITLTWDSTRSNVNLITGSKLYNLVIAGWDGSKWVNLGAANVSGSITGKGSISTANFIVPDNYFAYTFASITTCFASNTPPILSAHSLANACPASTVSLSSISALNVPTNCKLEWHTSLPASPSNRITNVSSLASGKYYAVFIDTINNCYASNGIISDSIIANVTSCCNGLILSVTKSDCSNASNNDGTVSTNITGGTSPYTYIWSNGATSSSISGLTPSSYSVTVKDGVNCTTSQSVVVSSYVCFNPSVTFAQTNVNCFGASTGSITANVSGGTFPYTYLWSNSAGNQGSTKSIINKPAGSYTVTVTDSKGCSASANASLNQNTQLTAFLVSSICNTKTAAPFDGAATVSATGGVPKSNGTYSFLWSNNTTMASISAVSTSGSNSVTVTDSLGCSANTSFSCSAPGCNGLAISSFSKTDPICHGAATGFASPSVSGGTTPYSFKWNNSATFSSLANIVADSLYTVTVTDNANCTVSGSVILSQPTAFSSSVSSTKVSCFGGSNGSIDLQVSGATAPYSYLWSYNNATTQDLNGLIQGTYVVTITDANNCSTSSSTTISQPASTISIYISKNNPTIAANNNGDATASATGGSGSYTFSWSQGLGTGNTVNGLTPGTYVVTATDLNGCTSSASVVISPFTCSSPSLTFSNTNVNCFGNATGSSTVLVSGGTSPYTYSWSVPNITPSITNKKSGSYSVTVTDSKGCTATSNTFISENSKLLATINSNCNTKVASPYDGSATVVLSGGSSPYRYQWVDGTNTIISSTNFISGINSGTYVLTVLDTLGCSTSETFSCSTPSCNGLTISSITKTSPTCNLSTDGSASLVVTGGTMPYSFTWSNNQTTSIATNLSGDISYMVTVKDNANCTVTSSNIVLSQPKPFTISSATTNISCFGGATGSIDMQVSGGTYPYNYVWSNSQTTQDIVNLSAGTYTVTVKDAKNCTITNSAILTQGTSLPVISLLTTNPSNASNDNGQISASVSGGSSPYNFSWSNNQNTSQITGLSPAKYCLTITDAVGCIVTNCDSIKGFSCLISSAPSLNGSKYITNICPKSTADLTTITANNQPNGSIIQWHKSLPASDLTKVSNSSEVTDGTYYAVFFNPIEQCYANQGNSATAVFVSTKSCSNCNAGTSAPVLSSIGVSNVCPKTTADLTSITANNQPTGTVLEWHSSLPITPKNKVTNISEVNAGSYYAVFIDVTNNCYSNSGSANAQVEVSNNNCTNPCQAGAVAPKISTDNIYNLCPSTTANLSSIAVVSQPAGTILEWHTSIPATSSNKILDPTKVLTGMYYAVYYDALNNCYSGNGYGMQTARVYTTSCPNSCNAGISNPILSKDSVLNNCPSMTADLTSILSSNIPLGTILEWHTSSPASTGNKVFNSSAVFAGTYYAVFYDPINSCYAGNGIATKKVVVSSTNCPNTCYAGNFSPTLSTNSIASECPSSYVNLNSIKVSNTPKNAILEWHTALPASANNKVNDPTLYGISGKVYAVFYDTYTGCYSQGGNFGSEVTVVTSTCPNLCKAGATNPILNITDVTNICPATTSNLNPLTVINAPHGTVLEWHTGIPATNQNKLVNTTVVGDGSYYAVFFDTSNNCYSMNGMSATQIMVTNSSCPKCLTPNFAPSLASNTLPTSCPLSSANLNEVLVTNKPKGIIVKWYNSNNLLNSSIVSNPSAVNSGTYYATFYDTANNCYSNNGTGSFTSVTVISSNCCNSGNQPPKLDVTSITNTCPSVLADLTKVKATNQPTGTVLEWHSSLPISSSTKVLNPFAVSAGTYYGVFFDVVNNCYSESTMSSTSLTVSIISCANCNSGNSAPQLSTLGLTNLCPTITADLTSVISNNQPSGTVLEWHTSKIVNSSSKVLDPKKVISGTYYATYYDPTNACYASNGMATTPLVVSIINCNKPCNAGIVSPLLSTETISNSCPKSLADLSIISASNLLNGTKLEWHTSTPATSSNLLSDVTAVGAGKYYAVIYDGINNCYSGNTYGTTPVNVVILNCNNPSACDTFKTLPNIVKDTLLNLCPNITADLTSVSGMNLIGYGVLWHTEPIATDKNKVYNPIAVKAGTYYASLYDSVHRCYSLQGYATKKVIVTTTNCPSPCYSGIESPKLDKNVLYNTCPTKTVNLNNIAVMNLPKNTVLTWHTSLPASHTNKVVNPTAVAVTGTYYASFYDYTNNCYCKNGSVMSSVWVELLDCNNLCASGTVSPLLSSSTLKNSCPVASADLSTILASNSPYNPNVILEWHTATPTSVTNKVSNIKSVGAGTYFAVFYDTANKCYSGNGNITSQTLVSIENCDNKCIAGNSQPYFGKANVTNVCPLSTGNLNNLVASNQPKGTIVEWRTSLGAILTATDAVVAGTYLAFFKDTLNNCYSTGSNSTITISVLECKLIAAVNDQIQVDLRLGVGVPISINLGANDTYNSSSIFTISSNGKPKKGSAVINPSTGAITYTIVDTLFIGYDTLVYNLCDTLTGVCSSASVIFTISFPKDTNIENSIAGGTSERNPVYIILNNNGIPILPIGASQSFSISQGPANGTTTIDPLTGKITYTNNANSCGKDSFRVARTYTYVNGTIDVFYTWVHINNNCESADFPNYISPNGDGVNDVFVLPTNYSKKYPDVKLVVFNRWGNIVWRSNGSYQNNWNGVNQDGQSLPDGVYYYMIEGSMVLGFEIKSGFVEINSN